MQGSSLQGEAPTTNPRWQTPCRVFGGILWRIPKSRPYFRAQMVEMYGSLNTDKLYASEVEGEFTRLAAAVLMVTVSTK